jgi:hypothetical protein
MSLVTRVILPTLIGLTVLVAPSSAAGQQSSLERDLDQAKLLYRDGRLDEAVASLRDVIDQLNKLRDQENRTTHLAEAHLYLGLAYFAVRDESAALQNFRQVAALDPGRRLDPEIYSPRVISLFDRARAEVEGPRTASTAPAPAAGSENRGASPDATGSALLPPGTRVRVTFAGPVGSVTGNLQALDDDRITLIDSENLRLSFPRETVTQLEVSQGRKAHWLLGTVLGTVAGALIGAADPPGCDADGTCWTRAENIGYTAVGLGLIGALAGALYRTDQWVEVSVDKNTSLISTTGERKIAVSFAWRY